MAFINGKETFVVAVKGDKGDKGDPREVKQVTGESKEAVMSQKAVTDAFDKVGLSYRSYELIYGTFFSGNPADWTDAGYKYRAVTSEKIPVKKGMRINFVPNGTYIFGYAFYNVNGVYDGIDRGWNNKTVEIEEDGYIYLNFGRTDSGDMQETEFETLKSICVISDNSLEKRIEDEVQAITDKFDMFGLRYRDYDIAIGNLQNGNISTWAGMSTTRAVTPEKIHVKAGMKILYNDASGLYRFGYAFYNTDGVYNGVDYGWKKATIEIPKDGYIAMNFSRTDEGEMSAEDYAKIKAAITIMDDSVAGLSLKNKLADIQNSIIVEYGRRNGASYVFARIPKTTNEGKTVMPHLAFTTADGAMNGTKESPLKFAKRKNTAFVINAGLFDMKNMIPVGQTIIDGETFVSAPMADDNGVAISDTECRPLCIDADGNLSAPYERTIDTDTMLTDGVEQSIVGWGRLVNNFEIDEADIAAEIVHAGKYIQQSIGQFENGDYCVCTVEQSRGSVTHEAGLTYTELAEILVEKGVKFAYALDGGGSAATVIGKRQLNRIYEGTEGRAVPTVLYFDVV